MTIAEMLLPEFDQEVKSTRKLLECVPDGKFEFKPHEKSMTLGRLAAHVAEMPNYMIGTLSMDSLNFTGEEKPFAPATRQELLDAFDKTAAQAREMLAKTTDEDMAKIWSLSFKGQQIFAMPRSAVLRSMVLSHLIHHRGQLGVYLRMNNVEFPGMYGPSADEMKMFQAKSA
ncbi:MAG: DinB family protein [Candidatus Acidiferrales bacterium]